MTDWKKIVEPRLDGSDTAAIVELVEAHGFVFPTPAGDAQMLLGAEVASSIDFEPKVKGLSYDAIDAGYVAEVEDLVECWPVYAAQVRRLLTRVYPTVTVYGRRTGGYGGAYGTRNQNVVEHFGQVYGTTDAPHVLAEAIVSSIGNWKLYAMGMKTLSWDSKLVLNPTDMLVATPGRSELQPIGVTLHAMYALHHIVEWNIKVAENAAPKWQSWARHSIKGGCQRLERGWTNIGDTLLKTSSGEKFFAGLRDWSDRILAEATAWQ